MFDLIILIIYDYSYQHRILTIEMDVFYQTGFSYVASFTRLFAFVWELAKG